MKTTDGVVPLLLAGFLACGGGTVSPADGGNSAADASDAPAGACEGTTPFLSEECGAWLQARCRALDTERACASSPSVVLGNGDFEFQCGWAKVVKFAEASSCRVASTSARCEAHIRQSVSCEEACPSEPAGLYHALRASVESQELMYTPCLSGDVLAGPIGRGTALANQQTNEREWYNCGGDSPTPPAALCACSAVACAQ